MKNEKVPQLRFTQFSKEWKQYKLESVTSKIQDGTHFSPDIIEDGDYKYITSKNIRNGYMELDDVSYISLKEHKKIYKRCDVQYNDVLITKDGASTGNVCLNELEEEFSLLSSVAFLRAEPSKSTNEFIYQYIVSPRGQREIQKVISGQAITRITLTKLRNFKFKYPSLEEQKRINDFLSSVDQKIQQLRRKKELLEEYKKGVMQKLFPLADGQAPEIRFKDENGEDFPDWEFIRGGKMFKSHSNKDHDGNLPLLAATQDQGVVSREEADIDVNVSKKSILSYKIVESGDFVISLRSFQGGIEYSEVKGLCSPAYIILKPKRKIYDDFFKYYFKKESFIERLSKTVVGIRDGKQISYTAFSGLKLKVPSYSEQFKIAKFLNSIQTKINLTELETKKAEEFKKGLLQQMFV